MVRDGIRSCSVTFYTDTISVIAECRSVWSATKLGKTAVTPLDR